MKDLINRKEVRVIDAALGADADLHLVGGCVRDTILGIEPKDIDLATALTPDEVEAKLTADGVPFVVTGLRRGTITAIVDGEPVEITTFRNPENEKEFVKDIVIDLAARDFTINAMAVRVIDEKLIDPFDGRFDLNCGVLRCVGDPIKRFTEDPHRILRMARFGWGAGRHVDEETVGAAMCCASMVRLIAPERIHDELIKIVCAKCPDVAIDGLFAVGALNVFLPELAVAFGVEQNKHHKFDVFFHTLLTIKAAPQNKILRLAAMFHDIGKPATHTIDEAGNGHFFGHEKVGAEMTKEIMERLKFSNEDIQKVVTLVGHHCFDILCGNAAIRRIIRDLGEETVFELMALKRADNAAGHTTDRTEKLDAFEARIKEQIDLAKANPFIAIAINGEDVMALGVKEGPEVGRLLKLVKEAVLAQPELNNKECLMEIINRSI